MIYVAVIFLLLLASVLFVPVGVELDYSENGRKWHVIWLGLRIPVPGIVKRWAQTWTGKFRDRLRGRTPRESPGEPRREGGAVRSFIEGLGHNLEAFRAGLGTLRAAARHVNITVRRLDVIVSTPDPALTGFSYGLLCAGAGALAVTWPLRVAVDFASESPRISFCVQARTILIRFIPSVVRLAKFARNQKQAR